MSDAIAEVSEKIAKANKQLEAILGMRKEGETALAEAEAVVKKRKGALAAVCQDEGALRGTIGDLKKMIKACDAVPLDGNAG